MNWKTTFRSSYYEGAPELDDIMLVLERTAMPMIDAQNTYLERPDPATLQGEERRRYDRWTPFRERMHGLVVPQTAGLLAAFRQHGYHRLFIRIGCHRRDGLNRSLSQKMPGWNNVLLPKDEWAARIVPALAPEGDEIVVTKTTVSELTGNKLRLILHNLSVDTVACCAIFTDQCVASTVRSLADESVRVLVVEDCCAAGSDELHRKELDIMNMTYCHAVSSDELPSTITPRRVS
jgi:nicotinamidase-related amidase